MWYTAEKVRMNSKATFCYGPLHPDMQVLDNQLELIYNSSVQTQDVILKTCQRQEMIETNGKGESWKSMLVA